MQEEPQAPRNESAESHSESAAASLLSCVQCRSRKLKCGRERPVCGRCFKQNETCSYPGSRQRAVGRRKTVRELEERIEQLENLLRAANLNTVQAAEPEMGNLNPEEVPPPPPQGLDLFGTGSLPLQQDLSFGETPLIDLEAPGFPQQSADQLIGLGLLEQLPSFDLIDELIDIYFQNVHAGAPMLHQASYKAAVRLPPHMRPPMCLQYIVMASAAATVDNYRHLAEPFYQRARVYAEADELKGQSETFMTLAHAECWCLISGYECHVYAIFTRASTSLCRAVRVAQMLKLHQLDVQETEAPQSGLPPARNWIETEERRRTWWMVFLADRYLTSVTGWPSLIDERHIRTNLPSSEESFAAGLEEPTTYLSMGLQQLEEGHGTEMSSFAVRILAANELLHALDHSSRHFPDDNPEDFENGPYWRRQKEIDRNLSTLALFLPEKLQLSRNARSLDAILIYTCTNMAIIQLHRTALGLMHRYSLPSYLISQSQARLLPAAEGILGMFRTAGDGIGAAIRNPLLSFAAYMAASVFLENFHAEQAVDRSRQSEDNLDFLARILVFFGRSSPLVRAMAFQLASDMKKTGYDSSMMDKVINQIETLDGSASEILKPSSDGLPMVFCPALTSTTKQANERSAFDIQIGSSSRGDGGSMAIPHVYMPGSAPAGFNIAPSVVQAGSPDGLFSQLATNSGMFIP